MEMLRTVHSGVVFMTAISIYNLDQLCPAQMAYWAKNYVTALARAAHWM